MSRTGALCKRCDKRMRTTQRRAAAGPPLAVVDERTVLYARPPVNLRAATNAFRNGLEIAAKWAHIFATP